MSTKKIVIIASASAAVFIAGTLAFFLSGNSQLVRRALRTQEQLVASDSTLAGRARQQAIDQMMRDVDKLDRDDLRKLWSAIRDRQREALDEAVDSYHAADASQREVLLDEHIASMTKWRDVYVALSTDSFDGRGGRGRRGGGGGPRNGEARRGEGRPGAGGRDGRNTGQQQEELTDEEKAKRAEERKRFTEYFTALEERRQKTQKTETQKRLTPVRSASR